jgi:hypothetical protein
MHSTTHLTSVCSALAPQHSTHRSWTLPTHVLRYVLTLQPCNLATWQPGNLATPAINRPANFGQSDGRGGQLAETSSNRIVFDAAERWLLEGTSGKGSHAQCVRICSAASPRPDVSPCSVVTSCPRFSQHSAALCIPALRHLSPHRPLHG